MHSSARIRYRAVNPGTRRIEPAKVMPPSGFGLDKNQPSPNRFRNANAVVMARALSSPCLRADASMPAACQYCRLQNCLSVLELPRCTAFICGAWTSACSPKISLTRQQKSVSSSVSRSSEKPFNVWKASALTMRFPDHTYSAGPDLSPQPHSQAFSSHRGLGGRWGPEPVATTALWRNTRSR